jgi:hypothetical protein
MSEGEPRFRLREDALDWLQVDDEVVVLDARKALYLGTNPAGALLWQALTDGATKSELDQVLIDKFGIDQATASRDAAAFLEALRQRDLLLEV